jgi:hypothetical protein
MKQFKVHSRTIIKADPGWYSVLWRNEQLIREPILAWEISIFGNDDAQQQLGGNHLVLPITTNGSPKDIHGYWAIQKPNGKFVAIWYEYGDTEFDNECCIIRLFREHERILDRVYGEAAE